MRCAVRRGYDPQFRNIPLQTAHRALAQRRHARDILLHSGVRYLTRRAESRDLRHSLSPRAHPALLAAAHDERLQLQPRAYVQRADALRGVDLVPADAYHVRAQRFRAEWYLHEALHSVRMQQRLRACALQFARNGGNIRHCAGFVIDHHQRNEYSIITERIDDRLHRYRAARVRLQPRHLKAALLKLVERLAYSVVLDGRADYMLAAPLHILRAGQERPVVALGAAGREIDLCGGAAKRVRDLLATFVQQLLCLASFRVRGARVAVAAQHRVGRGSRRLGAHHRCRGVIKIMFVYSFHLKNFLILYIRSRI